jgi:hypothetical protein
MPILFISLTPDTRHLKPFIHQSTIYNLQSLKSPIRNPQSAISYPFLGMRIAVHPTNPRPLFWL